MTPAKTVGTIVELKKLPAEDATLRTAVRLRMSCGALVAFGTPIWFCARSITKLGPTKIPIVALVALKGIPRPSCEAPAARIGTYPHKDVWL